MKNYAHRLDYEVRDYECDLSGIVNNANYQHYLEHARHKFLKSRGVNFSAWASQGIHLVVIRLEMDFLSPLHSGDQFFVGSNLERISRLRFGILQDIYRLPGEQPVMTARVVAASMNDQGRPYLPRELEALLLKAMDPLKQESD